MNRRIVAMFPLSISIAAAITFFTVSALILVGCLLPAMFESQSQAEPDTEVKTEQTGLLNSFYEDVGLLKE